MTRTRRCAQVAGRSLLAGAMMLSVSTACFWHRGRKAQSADDVRQAPVPIPLTVESRFREDVTIYVLRGGQRTRLGAVTAMTTQGFLIPVTFSGDAGGFRLLADPVGSLRSPYASEVMVVQPGQRVVWTLESRLGQSSLGIY